MNGAYRNKNHIIKAHLNHLVKINKSEHLGLKIELLGIKMIKLAPSPPEILDKNDTTANAS